MDAVGSTWPEGRYGEVIGPNDVRSYRIATAAALAGKSDRSIRSLARARAGLAVRARIPGRQGPPALFLDAAHFETIGRADGWWPPSASAVDQATGSIEALGAAVRDRIIHLERRVGALELELAEARSERDELLGTIESLTRMARRRSG